MKKHQAEIGNERVEIAVVRIAKKSAEIGGQENGRGQIFGIRDHQSRANKLSRNV